MRQSPTKQGGGSVAIPGIIQVDVTDEPTRELGMIREKSAGLIQTPVISAAAIYAAGDNVGGLLEFAAAALFATGGGILKDVTIVDDDSESAELELWLFNQTFTPGADNALWTPVEAELHNLLTILSTANGTYFTAGVTGTVCVIEASRSFALAGTSIFGRLVTRGTPTYTAIDDVSVIMNMLQD